VMVAAAGDGRRSRAGGGVCDGVRSDRREW